MGQLLTFNHINMHTIFRICTKFGHIMTTEYSSLLLSIPQTLELMGQQSYISMISFIDTIFAILLYCKTTTEYAIVFKERVVYLATTELSMTLLKTCVQ